MESSSNKIRVGIVGASASRGFASIAHVPALQALPEFELVAVCTARTQTSSGGIGPAGITATGCRSVW